MFSSATAARVHGFRAAAGRLLAARDVLGGAGLDHLSTGADAARRLLARGGAPDGVMCTSDLIAFAAHRVFEEAGAKPRVWGFDGSPLNEWVAPWLSSVVLPYAAFGDAVRDWVAETPGAERGVVLPFRLETRGDQAAASPRSSRRAR
jgi:LacI family transcriptional regulator